MTSEVIIKKLEEHRTYLQKEYGVERIGIFGSFAQGTDHEDIDLDLVVEFLKPIGFRFFKLAEFLEELLDMPIEILTPAGLDGIRAPQVAAEIKETLTYV